MKSRDSYQEPVEKRRRGRVIEYSVEMKKLFVVLLTVVIFGSITAIPTNSAPTTPQNVLVFFQNYLSKAESSYKNNLAILDKQFTSVITAKEYAIFLAKQEFSKYNQIRVLKIGDNRNYWGNFDCPVNRPACKDVDKGEKFEVGEVTTIKKAIADSVPSIEEIDLIVRLGLVELINPREYQATSKLIREETAAIIVSKAKYRLDSTAIEDIYAKAISVKPAITAIKRASKNPSIFQEAFVTAMKFKYNQVALDGLARRSFGFIDNLKALDTAIEVTRLSQDADVVASRYTYAGAVKINRICGKTFISDIEFMEMFKRVAEVYQQATGKKLKL